MDAAHLSPSRRRASVASPPAPRRRRSAHSRAGVVASASTRAQGGGLYPSAGCSWLGGEPCRLRSRTRSLGAACSHAALPREACRSPSRVLTTFYWQGSRLSWRSSLSWLMVLGSHLWLEIARAFLFYRVCFLFWFSGFLVLVESWNRHHGTPGWILTVFATPPMHTCTIGVSHNLPLLGSFLVDHPPEHYPPYREDR